MQEPKSRDGGHILVDQLVAQGVDTVFCVPGESYLAVLNALYDSKIDVIVCRNEGGAAMMAEAYGKLTGRPGICLVTRGPGATNASHGIHIASQDSTPLIMFVGQVDRGTRERDAFQEIDYKAFYGSIARWAAEIDDVARIPEFVARAFRVSCQGRPGPVVLALPEDMLVSEATVADAARVVPSEAAPLPAAMDAMRALLIDAKRPLMVLGGSRWSEAEAASIVRFAEKFELPTAVQFRRSHLISAEHPLFAGDLGVGPNPKLLARAKNADLILLVGGRFSEAPSSSYTVMDIPTPRQKLVHVHASSDELGRVYQPTVAIQSSPGAFAAAAEALTPPSAPPWSAAAKEARADYLEWSETPLPLPGAFQYGEVILWLRKRLPPDTIITNGAGNFSGWLHRYYRFRQFGTQLAPANGSMGYGVPAAVMAKRLRPKQPVIAFAGDGDFMMNGQEFATAVQYEIPIIVIVIDNGMLGTIRMHQEREYPGRVSATDLRNPDFAAYAVAFGGHGERVERTEEFAPAFERAVASGKPAILHCLIDPEALTPAHTLTAIREGALRR